MRTGFILGWLLCCGLGLAGAAQAAPDPAQVARGRDLVAAGDCVSCHSRPGGPEFAGGRAIATPFGTIYSTNITFDRDTGLGTWSEEDFYRALHSGIRKDGANLYPAMPYNYYTKLTAADVAAMYAYLETVGAVRNAAPAPELMFPLGWRWLMKIWNFLFFREGSFVPDPGQTTAWNRGAYLVDALGHCGACHTPTNLLGAPKSGSYLEGGELDHWFAPMLTAGGSEGLGGWGSAEIVRFLKTGANDRTAAFGPMAEVVENSTSRMNEDDLAAIVTYLKAQPAAATGASGPPDAEVMRAGGAIFSAQCTACHSGGTGEPGLFARLGGNSNVTARNPATVIRAILTGMRVASTPDAPTGQAMPSFDWKLTDGEVAAAATYVRNSWGNSAAPVSAGEVAAMRRAIGARPVLGSQ